MLLLGALLAFVPAPASAATWSAPFEISGWLPYWRAATSTKETLAHLDTFKEVNPFGYTVQNDGRLWDAAAISVEPWTTLRAEAKKKNIRYVPTVMWSNADAIHSVLSDPTLRARHIAMIVDEVKANDFDGIDIDYEGKYEKTRPYFTLFLKELYAAMGNKWVQCTVESRTPLSDRYYGTEQPADAGKYSNDFEALNKYCDRVKFMTYDQQTIDLKRGSEAEAKGETYGPVSDTVWVEKAIKEAMKTIPKNKIMLGIATYGYEWDVTAYAGNQFAYDLLWTFNPQYGLDLASEYNITPVRNFGGEMGFTYFPKDSPLAMPRPAQPWPGNLVAASAAALTTSNNTNLKFRMVTWQDSQAIADKVALAKKLGIRGVAVFKIDGGQDPKMWDVLK
jgi:spore germination protein YaaH